jgi:transcriptional regulator with XRE-family HTH domain
MITKTRPRDTISQGRYAPGTSRGARSATTLLAQVADIERGQRIKAQREGLHLTQPAVVDLIEAAARELPREHPLHPEQLGKAPVTLRGYQAWEKGGGVRWENAKLLAQVLHTDVTRLINGAPAETPDPFPAPVQEQLAEMGKAIEKQADALVTQASVLKELRDAVRELRELIATQQTAAQELDEAAKRIARTPTPADVSQPPVRARKATAKTSSPRASS